ncbi:efflux RND transporter periplasmic adaptor subunit [Paraburkholderia sp. BL9I2N2]|uniref:efflux RND transporter periplasmic adaptor subunit n=1 Tax=Paraburkholderia sp. BL9I2N2 TaxID=1938809 RepID=UPI00104B56B7|nr:efflux RND transporter periplasmic adaptor subunit [Paraburkholderia sp. BL9I2N2]TCK84341.1 membrane fusion protein (multidrug efflux system) [Paraburkholderia sp. BL9I2N2]
MKSFAQRAPFLCLGLIALAGCGKSTPSAPTPPQVAVVTVHARNVPLTRQLVGRLSPYYSANVTARVSGVLLRRLYTEGSEVRRAQPLFQIDPTFYRTQLDNDLALLAQDQATYVNDHITAQRERALLPVGSVSQQMVDNADAAERSAAAKVKADEAMVESARVNLGYTRVVSPISGIASQQLVTEGAVVGSSTSDTGAGGTLLTTVEQVDPAYVNFTISVADLMTLRQAQSTGAVALAQQDRTTVQIGLPDGTRYKRVGTLDFSDVAVNATTGAVNLRALVPNPQRELLPGMYVTLTVDLGRQNNVFLVPQQALQRDTVGAYLMAIGPDGNAVRKDVTATDSDGADWIVTRGLANGDRVIVSGLQFVHEGQAVKASAWQAPAAASSAPDVPEASSSASMPPVTSAAGDAQ